MVGLGANRFADRQALTLSRHIDSFFLRILFMPNNDGFIVGCSGIMGLSLNE